MCNIKALVILGAGGHGRVAADIARLNGYEQILFLDDGDKDRLGNYPVVGKTGDFLRYLDSSVFFVAVGSNAVREELFGKLRAAGARIVSLIHPGAVIGEGVHIGEGSVLMAGSVVNPGTAIGVGAIINTCSSVDHDCTVGDFVHVSVGARLCGTVTVGDRTMIGAGAVVINNTQVCADCVIGAGSVVVHRISDAGVYKGVPAK